MNNNFNIILYKVSKKISPAKFADLKFLCSGIIDKNKIDEMDELTFFKELKQRNLLDENNLDFLIDLLKNVGEDKIVTFLENYKLHKTADEQILSNCHFTPNDLIKIKETLLKSSELVKNWKFVFRHLNVADSHLNLIVSKHRDSIEEQIFQALIDWSSKDQNPSKEKIIEALKKCELKNTADQIATI